jgi:hypothetical protein
VAGFEGRNFGERFGFLRRFAVETFFDLGLLGLEVRVVVREQGDFVFAELVGELLEFLRLFDLVFQGFDLALHFEEDVLDAREVQVRLFELSLGLDLALLVDGRAGRFLEDLADVFRFRVEDPVDLALLDHRVAATAETGGREKADDVFQTAWLLVDQVFALAVGVEAAGQRDFRFVAVFGRRDRVVLGVVEDERHFRHAEGFAAFGAGEDDVGRLLAAQVLGVLFAHHPAHRVDDVRLTRTVGADDARDPLVQVDHDLVRERLKARNDDLF